jgi:hypothetical protein
MRRSEGIRAVGKERSRTEGEQEEGDEEGHPLARAEDEE